MIKKKKSIAQKKANITILKKKIASLERRCLVLKTIVAASRKTIDQFDKENGKLREEVTLLKEQTESEVKKLIRARLEGFGVTCGCGQTPLHSTADQKFHPHICFTQER